MNDEVHEYEQELLGRIDGQIATDKKARNYFAAKGDENMQSYYQGAVDCMESLKRWINI